MNKVLLTVSGTIDPEIEDKISKGERPVADYIAMSKTFGADLLDYGGARQRAGWFGKILASLFGLNVVLAWACYLDRRKYPTIFTDGEQVGIPLAFFLKFLSPGNRIHHLMIAHILSVRKKTIILDIFRLWSHIDIFIVYATWQKKYIEDRWQIPEERVVFTPFMVDSDFFSPEKIDDGDPAGISNLRKPIICSVGLEFRDYPSLIEAVSELDVTLVIAAASPWSKRADTTKDQELPPNVIVRRFSQYELRNVYYASEFVVMPLYNVNFQAGVTAILEAMAMSKAVICSRTPGQTDIIVDGETGIYVDPESPSALRTAMQYLLDHPQEARKMGENGRNKVAQYMNLNQYVQRLNYYVQLAHTQ